MDFSEDCAGSNKEIAVKREDRHAVENAAISAVVEVDSSVDVRIPLNYGIVSCSDKQSWKKFGRRVYKCNIPNPVDKIIQFVLRVTRYKLI